jgi:ABC-2 type transport system ATP-binding protein
MADLRRVPNAEDRVDDVLEILHLEDRAQGYIGNLSKGMRQRVGLAQAILHRPDVLILDEPTIGLDPVQIIEVRNLVRELGRQHTILLSTHILSEAQQVCNRVLIINKGHLVAEDTPERLQSRLTGAQRLSLQVGGDVDGLEPVIGVVPGVSAVSTGVDGRFELETLPGQDPRADVARAVVNAGYNLLEMRAVGMSLEDIFLQLTRDEPTPPEPVEGEFVEDEEYDEESIEYEQEDNDENN